MEQGSAGVVKAFFAAFGQGDAAGALATFHPEVEIVAVRDASRRPGELHGSYRGDGGAREFLSALGAAFETEAFTVDEVVGGGDVAYASGRFTHRVRATGKPFSSAWALRCVIAEGRIRRFRFYEDSAAYLAAAR
ncbi:MAG: nuclear transport factor 2 family protein [Anaeromyxobacter sp.]